MAQKNNLEETKKKTTKRVESSKNQKTKSKANSTKKTSTTPSKKKTVPNKSVNSSKNTEKVMEKKTEVISKQIIEEQGLSEESKVYPKNHIPEKSLQTLACALAVAVMILLMSGDYIITKFIPVKPNQEIKEEKKEPPVEEPPKNDETNHYDPSFLTNIGMDDLVAKIQNGETVLVLSGRESCGYCQDFLPVLKATVRDFELPAYYFDRSAVDTSSEAYQTFLQFDPYISQYFSKTPFLLYFKEGKYVNSILGYSDNGLRAQIEEMILKS